MPVVQRYFLEVAYKGQAYKGFQVQHNAITVQGEVQKALAILFRQSIVLTGSSRTDAGVHALQNFFHFDSDLPIEKKHIYNLNSILPHDISVQNIYPVLPTAHCRFDAVSRQYRYHIHRHKDPFLYGNAYHYPFPLDLQSLQQAASIIKHHNDFTSFSKRNTQVHTFQCAIARSEWVSENDQLIYHVTADRFLRGMVRALVATMLKVGRGVITLEQFNNIIEAKDCSQADFSAPPQGLFLVKVNYPDGLLVSINNG